MESYIFKTACGATGYFQKDCNDCKIFIENEFSPLCESYNWLDWERRKLELNASFPHTTIETEIAKGVSYFLWISHSNNSPDIIEIERSHLEAGYYCARINKGSQKLFEANRNAENVIDEVRSYQLIIESMTEIFNFIEPASENLGVYSHKIRELLNTACNEVEYLLLQILKTNGVIKDRYSTADFIRALPTLKLNEYSVALNMHPSLDTFSPFESWQAPQTTQTLDWYHDYNSVKHDRGGNFSRANLNSLINAVAAIHILLEAQYGNKLFQSPYNSVFESCFDTKEKPDWCCSELYAPLINEQLEIEFNTVIDCDL